MKHLEEAQQTSSNYTLDKVQEITLQAVRLMGSYMMIQDFSISGGYSLFPAYV
jgi:hypothetical protein